jgi:16S rRNA (cytidine1402-2'-O)-methyltransferase
MSLQKGKIYLIPTTLGDTNPLEVVPISVKKIVEDIDDFIVENEKSARGFIKSMCPSKSQNKLRIFLLNKFTDPQDLPSFLEPCLSGKDIGILSEAGCPGIADPGAQVVSLAHEKNIRVIPLSGPSSIFMALMASGLNGQSFTFNGYLPVNRQERKSELKRLEKLSGDKNQSQIFIETPFRNDAMLEDMLSVLSPNTKICIACDITLPTEYIKTLTTSEWKKNKVELHKRPTVFVFLKE